MASLVAKKGCRPVRVATVAAVALFGLASPTAWVSPGGAAPATASDSTRHSADTKVGRITSLRPQLPVEAHEAPVWHDAAKMFSLASVVACLVSVGIVFGAPNADASIFGPDFEIRNVNPMKIPVPDPNPYIRALQKKSWTLEPILRQRLFLKAMKIKLTINGDVGFFKPKYYVHWSDDSPKFDILEEKAYNEAVRADKLLVDADMSDQTDEMKVFVYKDLADQDWVQENFGVFDVVEIPEELQTVIDQIKATPFPEYKPRAAYKNAGQLSAEISQAEKKREEAKLAGSITPAAEIAIKPVEALVSTTTPAAASIPAPAAAAAAINPAETPVSTTTPESASTTPTASAKLPKLEVSTKPDEPPVSATPPDKLVSAPVEK